VVRQYIVVAKDEGGSGAEFLVLLEGIVIAVGAVFFAMASYMAHRWYHGRSVPFLNNFNSELFLAEFAMRPTRRMDTGITPDEFRT
jgi:hypothetical protein